MSNRSLRIVSATLALVAVAWILVMSKAIVGVLLLLAAAGFFVRSLAAAAPGAPPLWMQSSVLASSFFGVVAALVLALFVPELPRHATDLRQQEGELVETMQTLESIRYDAHGNVPDDERRRYESAMSKAKYLPENVATVREALVLESAISGAAALILFACGLVIVRAARRRRSPSAASEAAAKAR